MTEARIIISQLGASGPPGIARRDLVLDEVVTLSNQDNTGVRSWRWRLLDKPDGSTAALSGAVQATATFTPDVAGSYLIELQVDEGRGGQVTRTIAAVLEAFGATYIRWPAAGERNEANWTINGVQNTRGWTSDFVDAIKATYRRLPDTPLSIMEFGARVGEYDSTQAFLDAYASGRSITFPEGTFYTDPIPFDGVRRWRGVSADATILRPTGTGPIFQINSGLGIESLHMYLSDFKLDGAGGGTVGILLGQTVQGPLTGSGTFERIRIQNFSQAGIRSDVCQIATFRNIWIQDCDVGLHLAAASDNGNTTQVWDACRFRSNRVGCLIENGDHIIFQSICNFEENDEEGLYVRRPDNALNVLRNIWLRDAYFEENNRTRGSGGYGQVTFHALNNSQPIQSCRIEGGHFVQSGTGNYHVRCAGATLRVNYPHFAGTGPYGIVTDTSTNNVLVHTDAEVNSSFWTINAGSAATCIFSTNRNGRLVEYYHDATSGLIVRGRSLGDDNGTAAGNVAISGWGSTSSVALANGNHCNDSKLSIRVTSSGTGKSATPTITYTYPGGTRNRTPVVQVTRPNGTMPAVRETWTMSPTATVITFPSTPDDGTYDFNVTIDG